MIGSIGSLLGMVLSGALFLGILALRRRALKAQVIIRVTVQPTLAFPMFSDDTSVHE
jgi:hypothetical protein